MNRRIRIPAYLLLLAGEEYRKERPLMKMANKYLPDIGAQADKLLAAKKKHKMRSQKLINQYWNGGIEGTSSIAKYTYVILDDLTQ